MISSKPSQYTKGWVEFYKLKFKVTKDVLIPRPETELLVDEVLLSLRGALATKQSITILDLGTGSGNIAISIAIHLPTFDVGIKILATDVSPKALKVARQNAKLHGVEDKIEFVKSNLLDCRALRARNNEDMVIVTNLPYIPSARIPYLDSSVKDFEPLIALDGGKDGFELYRKLFQQLTHPKGVVDRHLKLLVGEIDYTHGELAKKEALKFFPKSIVEIKRDLAKNIRILKITD